MATHSSILAWEIPWTEEPGRLQSMEVTKESDITQQLNKSLMRLDTQNINYHSSRVMGLSVLFIVFIGFFLNPNFL